MRVRKHRDRVCPRCGEPLWYGVEEEPAGWKVFYVCRRPGGCGREWYAGRIGRRGVDHVDEVFARAENRSPL